MPAADRGLHLLRMSYDSAPPLEAFSDRTVFQTRSWLAFVSETQDAEVVVAAVTDGDGRHVGRFTGLLFKRFGLRMLGSPFPGWSTQYMGFNLEPGVSRGEALVALRRFAFRTLRCAHFEVMDRYASREDHRASGLRHRLLRGYEVDLTPDEDAMFQAMASSCRRNVRKAAKVGVRVEIAHDGEAFAEGYYAQLEDVFRKQGLVPTYPKRRVEALIRWMQPTDRLLLLRARDADGHAIASGIFPAWNDTMYFWGGASWRGQQSHRPNEALMWYAMRYWKARGIQRFDMSGGGDYKRKYGGREIAVPWGRGSAIAVLEPLREAARVAFKARQRIRGTRDRLRSSP